MVPHDRGIAAQALVVKGGLSQASLSTVYSPFAVE
jgi:hypothetical protein